MDWVTKAECHCGAVSIPIAVAPDEVTDCNCSFCHTHGVLWAYFEVDMLGALPDPATTDSYAWNGRHVDFHWCRTCGCLTHWVPRDRARSKRGVNARLLPRSVLDTARIRHLDRANTGNYID